MQKKGKRNRGLVQQKLCTVIIKTCPMYCWSAGSEEEGNERKDKFLWLNSFSRELLQHQAGKHAYSLEPSQTSSYYLNFTSTCGYSSFYLDTLIAVVEGTPRLGRRFTSLPPQPLTHAPSRNNECRLPAAIHSCLFILCF